MGSTAGRSAGSGPGRTAGTHGVPGSSLAEDSLHEHAGASQRRAAKADSSGQGLSQQDQLPEADHGTGRGTRRIVAGRLPLHRYGDFKERRRRLEGLLILHTIWDLTPPARAAHCNRAHSPHGPQPGRRRPGCPVEGCLKRSQLGRKIEEESVSTYPSDPQFGSHPNRKSVKPVHPHMLRHTFATSLLGKTGNLRLVQKALDHENPQTTAIYAHVVDEELQVAVEGRSAT